MLIEDDPNYTKIYGDDRFVIFERNTNQVAEPESTEE